MRRGFFMHFLPEKEIDSALPLPIAPPSDVAVPSSSPRQQSQPGLSGAMRAILTAAYGKTPAAQHRRKEQLTLPHHRHARTSIRQDQVPARGHT
jgi:hypothetical protein